MDPQVIRLAVLQTLASRTTGEGYNPVEVEGFSFDDVQTARHLKYNGLIDGAEVDGLGSRPEIEVSGLTEKGRLFLRALLDGK